MNAVVKEECIGECEICGLVDHHLVEGECPECREKYDHVPLGAEADIRHADGGRKDRLVSLDGKFRNPKR